MEKLHTKNSTLKGYGEMDSLLRKDEAAPKNWEEVESLLQKIANGKEMIPIVKKLFYSTFEEGQTYVINSMREIYNNDPCLFEEFFEDDDGQE